MMELGAQLFTLRDYTQTEQDLDFSLGEVAKMGYKTVQLSAVGPIPAEKLRELCDQARPEDRPHPLEPRPHLKRHRGRHQRARHHGLRLYRPGHDAQEVRHPRVAAPLRRGL